MPDDLLNEAKKAYVSIDDSRYKAEQELADRYRSFVSEILRLSLAGLAVFSFIYKNGLPDTLACLVLKDYFALIGIAMFAVSAALAVAFLYFASEGLRWYIAGLRYGSPKEADGPYAFGKETAINDYLDERIKWVIRCRWSKLGAALLLAGGGICMAFAIIPLKPSFGVQSQCVSRHLEAPGCPECLSTPKVGKGTGDGIKND